MGELFAFLTALDTPETKGRILQGGLRLYMVLSKRPENSFQSPDDPTLSSESPAT